MHINAILSVMSLTPRHMNLNSIVQTVHPEWRLIVLNALQTMSTEYLEQLNQSSHWLPGAAHLLAAFSHPLSTMSTILLGESPYPRPQSANGYAFWDNSVQSLWSEQGLSKEVNRATSLRNFMKMLLVARGDLSQDCSQSAIAALDRTHLVQTARELFQAMIQQGFLLLNADLVYEPSKVPFHSRHWRPFMQSIFSQLKQAQHECTVLLFGKIAQQVDIAHDFPCVIAPHPYNISFIHHPEVLAYFKTMDLLHTHD